MDEPTKLITIDGPAGSGKSTLAEGLASALRGVAFHTGRIYRAVTLAALEAEIDLRSAAEVLRLLDRVPVEVVEQDGRLVITVDGRVRSDGLASPEVTREIHWIADDGDIRRRLLPIQRGVRSERIVVAEGRDLGTVVFPTAPVKIFLTANLRERARRRHLEETVAGEDRALDDVIGDMERRDRFDQERAAAPLVAAPDAILVDNTFREPAEIVQEILKGVPRAWLPE